MNDLWLNTSERVLVLAPTAKDEQVAVEVLRSEGYEAVSCQTVEALCKGIREGCGAVVLAQEALTQEAVPLLKGVFREQAPWSDLPVVLLTGSHAKQAFDTFSSTGNISILERPFTRADLTHSVEIAIRARRKQYLAERLLAEQRDAAVKRDEFLATLSHELRTPLNVILGWTELLLNGDLSKEASIEALKILDRNARIQKSLIDDLLDTSRIITGKLYFELKPISLSKILEAIHREYLPRTKEKGVDFTLVRPEKDTVVFADDSRLSQVFTNLITNAIKFTPKAGRITMTLTREGSSYVVKVADTGQGMDADFIPHVFDRLKQEDMSTTRAHGGLGLGLSITSHIVEQHHGKIGAASRGRNLGSEFTVTLPAYDLSKVEAPTVERPRVSSEILSGVKVLVVDDSADIRQLIELWLRKANADVRLVNSGSDALSELGQYHPDILLSDIGMPEMDGYELIRKVRASTDAKVRSIPAAALTAYAKDEERTRALHAGFQAHISKPIAKDQLINAVSALIGKVVN